MTHTGQRAGLCKNTFLNLGLLLGIENTSIIAISYGPPEQHCACDRQSEMASDSQLSPAS